MKLMQQSEIEALRNDYSDKGIDRALLPLEPMAQFGIWFEQAVASGIAEPNGMVIATWSQQLGVTQRTVLMKSYSFAGFYFYTNYGSRKAQQLEQNPTISCQFPWLALHRQVSIQGIVEKASEEESARYFSSRPRASQIGAIASRQSAILEDRSVLEQRIMALEDEYSGRDIPVPEFWGGYYVRPLKVEFWQGRHSRLHDRYVYNRSCVDDDEWDIEQLYP